MTVTFGTFVPCYERPEALLGTKAERVQRRESLLSKRNRKQPWSVLQASAPAHGEINRGFSNMKTTTVLAIALGLGSLAACNKNPNEQVADNIEANAENTADTIEANADNAADNMQANAENTADQVRNAGENKADAVRNSADADGNSAH
jgi:hypothetical protein